MYPPAEMEVKVWLPDTASGTFDPPEPSMVPSLPGHLQCCTIAVEAIAPCGQAGSLMVGGMLRAHAHARMHQPT